MKMPMFNRPTRHISLGVFASMLALASSPVFSDLPGLPQAAPADSASGGRTPEAHAAAAAPTGPVRGSLFKLGNAAAAATAANGPSDGSAPSMGPPVSFISVQPGQPHRYRKNDILTIVVREDSNSTTNGTTNSKKTQDFDLALEQFLQLAVSSSGVPTVGTVNNPSKLPEIKFKYNNDRQSDASADRADSFSVRISGTVVDVKPNGTMVIEAVKQITVDKEEQTFKLAGICRVEDIAADNTILSTQLANLSVSKQTRGEVHDGTKRGWLNRLIDQVGPF